jgi:predicted LPLAT superfamily acyltransferase
MKPSPHWSEIQERSLIWGMQLLFAVYRLCGRWLLQVFLYPVVLYYWLSNRAARQASRDYLRRINHIAPELGLSDSLWCNYRHFISFANAIIDKLAAWAGALSFTEIDFSGREALLTDLQNGRGALLLACHLGNPEVCRVIASQDAGIRINVLVHTKHAEQFNRLLKRYNPASGLNLLQVTDINAATAMLLAEKIEQGELVIIAADRTPVGHSQRVSQVNFLGAAALLPQGPFILAGLLKCPVYSLFCLKHADKHRIIFEFFGSNLSWSRQERETAIQQAAQRYADQLQQHCLQAPLQWFNFYDFWRV